DHERRRSPGVGAGRGCEVKSLGRPTRSRAALVLCAVELAMFVAFGVLYLSPITPAAVWQSAGGLSTALFVFPFTAFVLVGGLIAQRRPENPIGWLILGASGSLVIGALTSLLGSLLIHAHNPAGPW